MGRSCKYGHHVDNDLLSLEDEESRFSKRHLRFRHDERNVTRLHGGGGGSRGGKKLFAAGLKYLY